MNDKTSLGDFSEIRQRITRASDMPAPPEIPDYRFIKVIGRGAFGAVWLTEETLAGVFRAIKVLTRSESGDGDRSRIERELSGIHAYQVHTQDHPHLVRILKTGRCDVPIPGAKTPLGSTESTSDARTDSRDSRKTRRTVYYVMEIADHANGSQPHRPGDYEPLNLATFLRRERRLCGQKVAEYAEHLLDAVDHLRGAGLNHRDIKPANVLFVGGVIKLADLGLTSSSQRELVGTPGFLPPDGTGDDVYALGKVMYVMTTGENAASFPEWPADLDPEQDVSLPQLRDLVNCMCHPDASQRLSDVREIRRRLAKIQSPTDGLLRVTRRRSLVALSTAFAGGLLGGGLTMRTVDRNQLRTLEAELAAELERERLKWESERREWESEHREADPTSWKLSKPPFDGTESKTELLWEGRYYRLWRFHHPQGELQIPNSKTIVCFYDLETRLAERNDGRFEVCGAFQIYNQTTPISGGIEEDRGDIDQIYLVVGDESQPHGDCQLVLLYHGQPGERPGVRSRFGVRGKRGIPLSQFRAAPPEKTVPICFAFRSSPSPEDSRSNFEENGLRDFAIVQIAKVSHADKSLNLPDHGG